MSFLSFEKRSHNIDYYLSLTQDSQSESNGPVDYIKKSDLQTEFGVFYHRLSPKIMLLKQPGLERSLNLPSPILDQFWTFWFKTKIPMINITNWLTLRPWNMMFVKKILSFLRWMGLIYQWFCLHPKKKGKNSKRGKILFANGRNSSNSNFSRCFIPIWRVFWLPIYRYFARVDIVHQFNTRWRWCCGCFNFTQRAQEIGYISEVTF